MQCQPMQVLKRQISLFRVKAHRVYDSMIKSYLRYIYGFQWNFLSQNFNFSLCMYMNLGQALDMIWDMTWSIAHDLWQSVVSHSYLLSTTRKRFPAGRSVSFRSGILFKQSAPRRRRNCAKYRIKFFLSEKMRKEKMQTRCVIYQRFVITYSMSVAL